MELYTNSRPSLVSERVSSAYNKMINEITAQNTSVMSKLYDNYIHPNLGVFILIAIIVIILGLRYFYVRGNKETFQKNHNIVNAQPQLDNCTYFGGMDDPLERVARPTFNPSIPICEQRSYVNYLPDTIPVNVNGNYVTNVANSNYVVPQHTTNNFQYAGPYCNTHEQNISDDMYKNFVDYNKQNLNEYNDILGEKINVF